MLLPIENAIQAANDFLIKAVPDARRVKVRKMAQIDFDSETGAWEVEAEVYVPNETVRSLGLPVQKEVLDCQDYLLRLDSKLQVVAYGLREMVEEK
jgi:hypothetical protein